MRKERTNRTPALLMEKLNIAQVLSVYNQENDSSKIPNESCPGNIELGSCGESDRTVKHD